MLAVDLRTTKHPPRFAWGVVGLLIGIAVTVGMFSYRESRQLVALNAQLTDLAGQLRAAPRATVVVLKKMPYDSSAREMLGLAVSDWPSMLAALESVEIVGVTPTALEISPAEKWIRVDVEFSDYSQLLEYINGLNAGDSQPRWRLIQAQKGAALNGTLERPGSAVSSSATLRGAW